MRLFHLLVILVLAPACARAADSPILDGAELDRALRAEWASASATPASTVGAEVWLRRAWLDLAGTVPPAADVARAGALDRAEIVARLTAAPEFETRWGRLLAAQLAGPQARTEGVSTAPLERFLAAALHADTPWWDVIGALASAGRAGKNDAADAARICLSSNYDALPGRLGAGLLGLRLDCARCHDDPVHGWTMEDHYGLAAFHAKPRTIRVPARLLEAYRAGRLHTFVDVIVNLPEMQPRGPDHRWVRSNVLHAVDLLRQVHALGVGSRPPPDAGSLDWAAADVYRLHRIRRLQGRRGDFGSTAGVPIPGSTEPVRMPKPVVLPGRPARAAGSAGRLVSARFPGAAHPVDNKQARPETLTAWVRAPSNPYASRALVNRVWSALVGRGLVEPQDEVGRPLDRAHEKLLERLAAGFARSGGNVKQLVRLIVLSRAYDRDITVAARKQVAAAVEMPVLIATPTTSPSASTTAPRASLPAAAGPSVAVSASSILATASSTPSSASSIAAHASSTPASPSTTRVPASSVLASAPTTTAAASRIPASVSTRTAAASSIPASASTTTAAASSIPASAATTASSTASTAVSTGAMPLATGSVAATAPASSALVFSTAGGAPAAANQELLGSVGFSDSDATCTRERDRDRPRAMFVDPACAAMALRPLDVEQVLASLAAATGRTDGAAGLREEVGHALELWEETAEVQGASLSARGFPPRVYAAGPGFQDYVRSAPLLADLARLDSGAQRLERMVRAVLQRAPTAAERAQWLAGARAASPWGADAARAWTELLAQLLCSAEFMANH